MAKLEKSKLFNAGKAEAAADIALINHYSVKELKPEEIYCFSVILCDNDIDRDGERFTNAALDELAKLFAGKTGIMDHRWSATNQIARIYRTEVEKTDTVNTMGEPLRQLKGYAYMIKNEANQPLIDAIDGGILKEVSVGCAVKKCTCSICGESFSYNWENSQCCCKNGHEKGAKYNGKICAGNLEEPTDAYEFSFVAVPAQKGAGVTKSIETLDEALDILLSADLSKHINKVRRLVPHIKTALTDAEERSAREKILRENEKFRRKD